MAPIRNLERAAGESHWRALIAKALRGAPFESLTSLTEDGQTIQPLYARARPAGPADMPGRWRVMARVDHPDAEQACEQARDDLANGADGLEITAAGAPAAFGYGVAALDRTSFEALLQSVTTPQPCAIALHPGASGEQAVVALADALEQRFPATAKLHVSFGMDPIGMLARHGRGRDGIETSASVAHVVKTLAARNFTGPFVSADGALAHDAGASPGLELGYALSCAIAYMRGMEQHGLTLDQARRCLAFRLAGDADQLMTIAKFRAVRLLWGRVEQACGLAPRPIRLHAQSGNRTRFPARASKCRVPCE